MADIKIGNLPIDKAYFGNSEISAIYFGNVKVYESGPAVVPYLTFSSPNSFTLNVVNNQKYWDGTLEYSTDTNTWNTWSGTSAISSASDGTNHVLYMRGTGNTYITGSNASSTKAHWVLTGSNISCIGNIENLLDYATVSLGNHPVMADYCYYNMFYGCTSLITVPSLPATTLTNSCYRTMFRDCSLLITAPALPATTLVKYCYSNMFRGCTSLTSAHSLPATTLVDYCYQAMFYGCSSLTSAPALPATTLASECYSAMFFGCTSLYVSDTQTTEAQYAWRIPTSAVISGSTYLQSGMFTNCLGTRSSNDLAGASGNQYTYYTQNQPIS